MPRRKRTQTWSYIAGKRALNRVRAYEETPGGPLFLDYQEPVAGPTGEAVRDPATGHQLTQRKRPSLAAIGITTYAQAVVKAEEMAELILNLGAGRQRAAAAAGLDVPSGETVAPPPVQIIAGARGELDGTVGGELVQGIRRAGVVQLGPLVDLYFTEVVPNFDPDTRKNYEIAARQFRAFFGDNAIVEHLGTDGRPVTQVGKVRYNAWRTARHEGTIVGFPTKCGRQTVLANFRFLRSVFEWGMEERDDGLPLLIRNPWGKFSPPPEDNPTREEMTLELHQQIRDNAPNWRMALVMELCRETRRRMNSVRNLLLTDLDLEAEMVTWRAETDKARRTTVTALTPKSVETIRRALELREEEGVGASPWLFPAPTNPEVPVSENSLHNWMKRTRDALGIKVKRLGFHGEKRAGIRDPLYQQLPEEWREAYSGTTIQTEKRIYGFVGRAAQRQTVAILSGLAPAPITLALGELPKAA